MNTFLNKSYFVVSQKSGERERKRSITSNYSLLIHQVSLISALQEKADKLSRKPHCTKKSMVKCTLISINLFQSPNPILAGEGMLPLSVFLPLNIMCTDDGIKIELGIALISANNGLQFESNPQGLANYNKHCPGPSNKPQPGTDKAASVV